MRYGHEGVYKISSLRRSASRTKGRYPLDPVETSRDAKIAWRRNESVGLRTAVRRILRRCAGSSSL